MRSDDLYEIANLKFDMAPSGISPNCNTMIRLTNFTYSFILKMLKRMSVEAVEQAAVRGAMEQSIVLLVQVLGRA
jgi:hypothetical protein